MRVQSSAQADVGALGPLVFLELGHCNFRNILDVPSVDAFVLHFPFHVFG